MLGLEVSSSTDGCVGSVMDMYIGCACLNALALSCSALPYRTCPVFPFSALPYFPPVLFGPVMFCPVFPLPCPVFPLPCSALFYPAMPCPAQLATAHILTSELLLGVSSPAAQAPRHTGYVCMVPPYVQLHATLLLQL